MLHGQGHFLPEPGSPPCIFALESSPGEPKFPVPETVAVAQLVEPLIVVQVVAGSSPVGRPTLRVLRITSPLRRPGGDRARFRCAQENPLPAFC